jgi:CHRD domain
MPFVLLRIKTIDMHHSPRSARTIFPAGTLVAACALLALFISCGKKNGSPGAAGQSTGFVNYTGTFVNSGSTDSSKATGSVTATFNQTTLTLTYSISWSSLTSLPIMMHFHDNGPVIVVITGYPVAQTGTVSGTCKLTSTQATDLSNGDIYAMIHTVNYGAGEIYAPLVQH